MLNPPYQLSDGGAQASAKPIYHLFVENSIKLSPHYLTMIIPARWYASGKGLESFRQKFISDTHIRELHDYPNTNDCFPGVNVRGGICYFLWDSTYNNIQNYCRVVTHDTDNLHSVMRPLQIQGSDIFIRYAAAIEVINKVKSFNECSIAQHISPRRPYGIDGSIIKTSHFHHSNYGLKRPVICYGKAGTKGYIEYTDVVSHIEWIDKWKVYMPYANNIGTELNDDNQNTFVGEPNSVCSETFIMIGAEMNLTKESAKNLCLYMRTKFARFLHSLSKTSQHGTAKTYQFVPTQDFTKSWTDEELYVKYGLTQEEIDFIESMIKPMETGGEKS